jgi:hypothetical protein
VSNDDVDLIVMGWDEQLDMYSWTVTYNCVPAGPWEVAKLPVDAVFEDFEDDVFNINVAMGGNKPWALATDQHLVGSSSLKSGAISASQTSTATITLPYGATTLDFWYYTDTQAQSGSAGDLFTVALDGVVKFTASGQIPWAKLPTLDVSNAHTVTLAYTKDATTTTGADAVWVDNLRIGIQTTPTLRADAMGSVLSKPAGPTDTVVYVAPEAFELWTTDPNAFPFNVRVGGEVMAVNSVTGTVADEFDRTVSSGWGVSDTGQTWSYIGSTSDFSVKGV